jgi:hypothetical protein
MRERLQSTQAKELIELVLMSDTHEQHKKVDVPHGDLLIHAGDFTYFNRSPSVVRDFNGCMLVLTGIRFWCQATMNSELSARSGAIR